MDVAILQPPRRRPAAKLVRYSFTMRSRYSPREERESEIVNLPASVADRLPSFRGVFTPPSSSERIKAVNRAHHPHFRRAAALGFLAGLILAGAFAPLHAQAPNPTSAANAFFGSVTTRQATDELLKLSLDEAIALGLKNNLGLKEAENGEKSLQGTKKRSPA